MPASKIPASMANGLYILEHHSVDKGLWDTTFLQASYQPYAIRNTLITLVTHIPVFLFLHCVSIFPNAFARSRTTTVFTTHGLLLFSLPQYILYAGIALLVWDDWFIPIGVCSILKNFTMSFAQIGYSVIPIVAVVRYLSVVWQSEFDRTQAWLGTLLLAVPNIALAIAHTFFGTATPSDICDVITVYHSDSGIITIQSYMILQQFVAIVLHLRVAFYLRKLEPDKRPRLMNHSYRFKSTQETTEYCISLVLLIHTLTILAAMAMQSAWALIYLDHGHSVKRTFLIDLLETLPMLAPGLVAIASILSIRESRHYVRQLTKRARRANPRIVTTSVSVIEN